MSLCAQARPHHHLRRLLLAALVAVLPAAVPLEAQTTREVPTSAYPTIQSAIDASVTGDTVLVDDGIYFEQLSISGKSIQLESVDGAADAILDGGSSGTILSVSGVAATGTTITGFTLQNGFAGTIPAAGISINDTGITLDSDSFQNNTGPAIAVSSGTVTVLDSDLSTAPSDFGNGCDGATAILVSGTSTVRDSAGLSVPITLTGNTISGDGTTCSGTAIDLRTTGFNAPHLIENNILTANALGLYLAVDDGSTAGTGALILQNLVTNNANGAATLVAPSTPGTDPANVLFINNTIANNITLTSTTTATAEITLTGTAARTAFLNDILVGSSTLPVLFCDLETPSLNVTPLILDHTAVFNAHATVVLAGDCTPGVASPLATNGNLAGDPLLTRSFQLSFSSPALDAGTNSAPGLPPTDLDGNPRIVDATGIGTSTVDLGAYELYGSADSAIATVSLTAGTYQAGTAAPVTLTATTSTPGTVTFLLNGSALAAPVHTATTSAILNTTLSTPGLGDLSAAFTPDAAGTAPTVSPVAYVSVLTAATLTISASSTTNVAGQPVLITIHLGATDGTVPPGAILLTDTTAGITTQLTTLQPDSTGLATVSVTPAAGTHIYTISFAGTNTYSAATASTTLTLTGVGATSTTLTASPSPASLGSPVTLTATVTDPSAALVGSVTFTADGQTLGTVPVTNGGAVLSVSTLTVGSHQLTASFTSTVGLPASTASATLVVSASTATTLTAPVTTAGSGDAVPYTVTVSFPGATYGTSGPVGTVSLTDGSTLLGSAALTSLSASAGTATFTVIDPNVGARTLTATFTPGPNLAPSSATLPITITAAPTPAVTLAVTPNPASFTTPVTLSVNIANPPVGSTLTLLDGAAPLPLTPTLTSATYTLSAGTLAIGIHNLTAILRDAAGHPLAASAPLTETITNLSSTFALTAGPGGSVPVDTPVTLTASLTTAVPAGHTLSGTVLFRDGNTLLASSAISPTGQATFTISTLAAGTHTLTATWAGDDLLGPGAASLTETVLLNPTATTLTVTPLASAAFLPVTLSAQVTSPAAVPLNTAVCTPACAPTAVTFFADTAAGHTTLGTVSVDSTGRATLVAQPQAALTSFSAVFSGSPLFATSTSPTVADPITAAPTTLILSASPNPLHQLGSTTLTVTLAAAGTVPSTALAAPITLSEGTTTLGTITGPTGTLSWTPSTTGTHTLTATFAGSTDLQPSTATITVNVLASGFTLTLADSSLTLATEHHATTTLTLSGSGDFADTIDLTCDNLPTAATCTFSPVSTPLSGNGTAGPVTTAIKLTLDTDFIQNWASLRHPPTHPTSPAIPLTLAALSLPAALFFLRRRGTRLPNLLALLLLSALPLSLLGCSAMQPAHTADGAYTVTVTAHARTHNATQSATMLLTVTQ